jgi:Amt family ammonium transporter
MKRIFLTLALAAATFLAKMSATAADAAPAAPPSPTPEQRLSAVEAYINNGDPTAGLKDKDGKIADGLTTPAVGVPGPGHNAWMMASAALVLFMTLPGLFLFYGGLVRRKNILSVIAQCFGIAGLVTILWVVFGYSTVFSGSGGDNIGKEDIIKGVVGSYSANAMLKGVTSAPNTNYAYWVSQNVFSMYQLMFAIITPALILGAIAERLKFSAMLLFMALWMVIVYFPLAHMVWGINGMMNGVWNPTASIHAIDFAGGTVVHMSSGWSALILCMILGKRLGFGKQNMAPHSMVLCAIGTGMLWVGWYGFNAGSAVAADGVAANAFMTTTIATAVASFVWPVAEWLVRGKPSVLGFCSGAVAGLVVITPACGFVNGCGAIIIGIAAGLIPWFFCYKVKGWFGYDDALDTFGVHAVGGTLGAFLTGVLAVPATLANGSPNPDAVNGNVGANVDKYIHAHSLWFEQVKAIGVTLVLAIVGTIVIAFIVKAVVGLRPSAEVEAEGLDISEHGEEGYHGEARS